MSGKAVPPSPPDRLALPHVCVKVGRERVLSGRGCMDEAGERELGDWEDAR